jgi:hypothetical protein
MVRISHATRRLASSGFPSTHVCSTGRHDWRRYCEQLTAGPGRLVLELATEFEPPLDQAGLIEPSLCADAPLILGETLLVLLETVERGDAKPSLMVARLLQRCRSRCWPSGGVARLRAASGSLCILDACAFGLCSQVRARRLPERAPGRLARRLRQRLRGLHRRAR